MNRSIPTGSSLEFVNIRPFNPFISKCEIKVLYAGANRNRSFISKEVANKMANSLPGTPIVGHFREEVKDFEDHNQLVIDEDGVRFESNTVPYGFIPFDAKVWWANYVDYDGVEREYLVTEGYLWTGRYPECKRIIEKGNHQSMELDGNSCVGEWGKVSGEWSKRGNADKEYFIISDATFTAICILGEDVEPCFEGANATKPITTDYSLNKEDFKKEMLDFMADLKNALNDKEEGKGGILVKDLEINVDNSVEEFAKKDKKKEKEKLSKEEEKNSEDKGVKKEDESKEKKTEEKPKEEKKPEDKKDNKEKSEKEEEKSEDKKEDKPEKKEEEKSEDKKEDKSDADEEEKKKKKKIKYCLDDITEYQELLVKFNDLTSKFEKVSNELEALKPEHAKFKKIATEAENKAKDDMINSFYMLSDEDKKEVIENKENFSLSDIEAKLSVICVRNKVNFDLEDANENEDNTETPITTFSITPSHNSTPAWLRAVEAVANNRK